MMGWSRVMPLLCATALAACGSNGPLQARLSPAERLQIAQVAERSGDDDMALSMYAAAASGAPDKPEVQLNYARALARAGRIAAARDVLRARLASAPGQPDLTRELANLDVLAGQPAAAITAYDQLLAKDPADTRSRLGRGVALDVSGQHALARLEYAQLLRHGDDVVARNDMALSYLLDGHYQEARDTLAPVGQRDDVPPRIRNTLALAYAALGDLAQARSLAGETLSDDDLRTLVAALPGAALPGTGLPGAAVAEPAATVAAPQPVRLGRPAASRR